MTRVNMAVQNTTATERPVVRQPRSGRMNGVKCGMTRSQTQPLHDLQRLRRSDVPVGTHNIDREGGGAAHRYRRVAHAEPGRLPRESALWQAQTCLRAGDLVMGGS